MAVGIYIRYLQYGTFILPAIWWLVLLSLHFANVPGEWDDPQTCIICKTKLGNILLATTTLMALFALVWLLLLSLLIIKKTRPYIAWKAGIWYIAIVVISIGFAKLDVFKMFSSLPLLE